MQMNKAALTSIQPPHTDNIFDLVKSIEWRTKPLPMGKHYCYETKNGGGIGKVIGTFRVCEVIKFENASLIPEAYIDLGCVPKEFLMEYSKGKPIYANCIVVARRYDKPKELSEFTRFCDGVSGNIGCRGCEYYYIESNESIGTYEECLCDNSRPLKRPPQSWCYVEELKGDRTE